MRTPWLADPDFVLYVGDVREVLATLPAASVDCCVTSPPYWNLRDYGTATWQGGDPDCDHLAPAPGGFNASGLAHPDNSLNPETIKAKIEQRQQQYAGSCRKCGATRVDQQIGLEATPEEYVASLVAVFREVRRVLKPSATLWLNLGDSYAGGKTGRADFESLPRPKGGHREGSDPGYAIQRPVPHGFKPKDLVGIPWRVAFALQADGWYLRSDIIWSKPNPMPESVTDRPTKAHEYLFLLSKQPRYFFDQEAIREPAEWNRWGDQSVGPGSNPNGWIKPKTREELNARRSSYRAGQTTGNTLGGHEAKSDAGLTVNPAGRNVRSVWEIATQPYAEAHFATFPDELPRRCIAAGCPAGGTVLDPFIGSGTTALVARRLGRKSVGIELNADYAALCARRLQQLSLLHDEATA